MGYMMAQRYCSRCRRKTSHWCEQGVLPAPHGWQAPLVNLSRAFQSAVLWRWHCLECKHPWGETLLRRPPRAGEASSPPTP